MLQDIRPGAYTITIEGEPQRLRFDLNALDYLERACGGIGEAFADGSIAGKKKVIRAALLCNYPENGRLLEEGRLPELRPTLYEVGAWFDLPSIEAVCEELLTIALEQTAPEGEQRLGERGQRELEAAIGALWKLYGPQTFTAALKACGVPPPGRSSRN